MILYVFLLFVENKLSLSTQTPVRAEEPLHNFRLSGFCLPVFCLPSPDHRYFIAIKASTEMSRAVSRFVHSVWLHGRPAAWHDLTKTEAINANANTVVIVRRPSCVSVIARSCSSQIIRRLAVTLYLHRSRSGNSTSAKIGVGYTSTAEYADVQT